MEYIRCSAVKTDFMKVSQHIINDDNSNKETIHRVLLEVYNADFDVDDYLSGHEEGMYLALDSEEKIDELINALQRAKGKFYSPLKKVMKGKRWASLR